MLLPRQSLTRRLESKDEDVRLRPRQSASGSGPSPAIIAIVAVAIIITVTVLSYITARWFRKRHPSSRWIFIPALKRRWENWDPTGQSRKGLKGYNAQRSSSVPTLLGTDGRRSNRASQLELGEHRGEGSAEIERHTSVRSIMTLPAYSSAAREDERILGREGERAGIDVVIEAPETEDMAEERREEEMESLYQIRLQRRAEIAERNARREERRLARERGDFLTLQRLRHESARRAEEGGAAHISETNAMIAEHQSRSSRERRVSSVSYGDLGVARHDGSRVRAASQDSGRGLLSDAASIGGRPGTGGRDSLSVRGHWRDLSGSAVSLNSDDGSEVDGVLAPPFGRAGSDFEVVNWGQEGSHSRSASRTTLEPFATRSRASSGASMAGAPPAIDTGAGAGQEPPSYDSTAPEGFEDAPPYTSPVRERATERLPRIQTHERSGSSAQGAPSLPGIERLPSIRIADPTPVEPRGPEAR